MTDTFGPDVHRAAALESLIHRLTWALDDHPDTGATVDYRECAKVQEVGREVARWLRGELTALTEQIKAADQKGPGCPAARPAPPERADIRGCGRAGAPTAARRGRHLMSGSEVYDVLRRVEYGGRQLWAATPPPGPAQDVEGTGVTREAALLDLVRQLAAQRPRPQVSVNVVIDATLYSPAELDQVLAKVRELKEAGADVR